MSQTERHEVAPRKEYLLYPCALLNRLTITRLGADRPAADLGNLSNSLTFSLQKGRLTPSPCVWATLNGGTMARGFPGRSHTRHCGFHWLPPLGLLAREVAGCHAVRALKQPTEKPARGGPKAPLINTWHKLVSHGNGHACIHPLSQLVLNPRKVPGTMQGSGHTGESKQTSTLNEAHYHSLLEHAGILRTPGPLHTMFPTSVEIAPTLSPISGRGKLLGTL